MLDFIGCQRIKEKNLLPLVGGGLFILDKICMHGANDMDVIFVTA